MFEPMTHFLWQDWQTYTFALFIGSMVSWAWLLMRAPDGQRGAVADTALVMMIAGIISGRALYVALQWAYFGDHPDEMMRITQTGGLDWHGVVVGALLVGIGVARLRHVDWGALLDSATVIVPILAFSGWWACASSGCAYGKTVDSIAIYPFISWIERDIFRLYAPRFAVQPIGMALMLVLLVIVAILFWRGWLVNRRFWLVLILVSGASFGLGFLRDDWSLVAYGLRAGQWLDLGLALLAVVMLVRPTVR